MRYFFLILPVFLAGCLAGQQTAHEDIQDYIRSEEPRPGIAKAMRMHRVATTMTKEQIRLVMAAKEGYTAEPSDTRTRAGRDVWVYHSSTGGDTYQILFGSDGRVENFNRQ